MDEERERRKSVFYEELADGAFKFTSGEILRVQTAILAEKSLVFHKLFKDSSDRVVEISDYDITTFRLFLDCLMDYQDYSVIDALLIFPMALKYQTKKFISECLRILEPEKLNENLCLTLNLAMCCKCEELQNSVINFLEEEKLIYRIFHEEKFYSVLEPESVYELLQNVKIDSYIIQIVFKWGKDYLTKNNKTVDLKNFFLQNGIAELLDISSFETIQAMTDFNDSELGNNFYLNNVQDYVKRFGHEVDTRKCAWVHIKAGESLTEKFVVKNFALLSNYNVSVKIFRNPIVFYQYPENEKMINYDFLLNIEDATGCVIKTEKYANLFETLENVLEEKVRWSWKFNNASNCISNFEFEVKRTFNYDCRILKRAPKNFVAFEPKGENLFITDYVELELVAK